MDTGIPKVTREFKEFIISLLRLGKLTEKRIEEFTDGRSMELFRVAFIHKSYGSEDNYELAEFMGDPVLNSCIAFYLKQRFPEVLSTTFITRLKHDNISGARLAIVAEDAGFLNHILYGSKIQEIIIKTRNLHNSKDYMDMLEDTFEAFIGTVVNVIDGKTRNGVGNPIACNIITFLIDKINISLIFEDVFKAKPRLKEVYDKPPLRWEIKEELETTHAGRQKKATIYGYPSLIGYGQFKDEEKPLRDHFRRERRVIAVGYGDTLKIAENEAAENALQFLADKYNIYPVERKIAKDVKSDMPKLSETPDFKEFIVRFLKLGRVNDDMIGKFTDKKSMKQFRYAFIHKSYGGEEISGLSKYLGDVVVDNCITSYLKKRFQQIVSVKYLTRLKHNITENDLLGLCVEKTGILKYILYGDKIQETMDRYENHLHDSDVYTRLLKGAFSALIGVMVTIIDSKIIEGAGYPVAYNIIFHYLNKISISLDYESVFDPKTRLKEVYDKRRWTDSKWSIKKELITRENKDNRTWHTVIYGYPYGGKGRDPNLREIIGEGEGTNIKKSQDRASENALITLRSVGIHEVRPDPYKKN
uniref:Ribonuclease III n=1 Tax=Marseillevirus LCMAC101 TaxID=2506602 RepID=A0A481YRQ0_9VIRU|nr:MAG: ribonuclease III [Marseillevirus LCMAC101]